VETSARLEAEIFIPDEKGKSIEGGDQSKIFV